MSFAEIAWFVTLEVSLFLGALVAIIGYRVLTGQINTKYLLYGTKKGGAKYLSPERVQLLLFTLGTAMFYLNDVIQHRGTGVLPDVSKETLALLGGSHAIYLSGKAYMMLFKEPSKGE
jgi:hypothetical protein